MPVTLRTPNNPATESRLFPALAQQLVGYPTPNTNLAAQDAVSGTGISQIKWNNKSALLQPATLFPAVHLSLAKPMRSEVQSLSSRWIPVLPVLVEYYDVWTETTRTFDSIWGAIGDDLQRMCANIEDNQTIAQLGVTYCDGVPVYEIEQYDGHEFDKISVANLTLVRRTATLYLQQLGYITGS